MLQEKKASIIAGIGKKLATQGAKMIGSNAGKISHAAKGSLVGGTLGGLKAQSSTANDPNLTSGEKLMGIATGIGTGALGGAATGALASNKINQATSFMGKGVQGLGNKMQTWSGGMPKASSELDYIYREKVAMIKKSEMECPTDEEKANRLTSPEEEVKESPNDKEKKEMKESLTSKEVEKKMEE